MSDAVSVPAGMAVAAKPLGTVEQREHQGTTRFEILALIETFPDRRTGHEGAEVVREHWRPVASNFVFENDLDQFMAGVPAGYTISDMLVREGWTPPSRRQRQRRAGDE